HQYMEQLPDELRSAIIGNVGTLISFRIGTDDASYLAKEFYPTFNEYDLIHLPRYCLYLKLCIDGTMSYPFSATTFLLPEGEENNTGEIIESSRKKYGKSKTNVKEKSLSDIPQLKQIGLFE
ncbi:MAG: hypothetical protein K1X81_01785, partial [Bacteroidia bacterium]|nr:hypothetical protein [Bacteroidia bacterium]